MREEDDIVAHERAVRFLSKHFVSLYWTDPASTLEKFVHDAYSAFVISVAGKWRLITAGHILGPIDRALKRGDKLDGWFLDDGWSLEGKRDEPVPFDLAGAKRRVVGETSNDYGVIHIDGDTARRLADNHIVAGDESVWEPAWPAHFDGFSVLGLPTKGIELLPNGNMSKMVMSFPVTRIMTRPEYFRPVDVQRFYGEIKRDAVTESQLRDFDGMSGGPIFGFQQVDDSLRYWIVAVQTESLMPKRMISGCYLEPLIRALKAGTIG